MSIFGNMFGGAPKPVAPTTEVEESHEDEIMGAAEETQDVHYSTNAEGLILTKEEQDEIKEQNKYGREQA